MDAETVKKRVALRRDVLLAVYHLSEGSTLAGRGTAEEVPKELGITQAEYFDATEHLVNEGLLARRNLAGDTSLTAAGVRVVERDLAPQHASAAGSVFGSVHVYRDVGVVIQGGSGHVANVSQQFGMKVAEASQLLGQIVAALPESAVEEREIAQELAAVLSQGNPKPSAVKVWAKGLFDAVKGMADLAPKVIELLKLLGIGVPHS